MAVTRSFRYPAETERHAGTMMAWPTESSLLWEAFEYPGSSTADTRAEVSAIAKAIAKYEPLHLFVKDRKAGEVERSVKDTNLETAKEALGNVSNVTIHVTRNVHSLWARDTGPVFVRSQNGPVKITWGKGDDPGVGFLARNTESEVVGMLLNYNQWGRKNNPNPDMYLAAAAAEALNRSAVLAPFIAEGGALEFDGEGTLMVTESSILNPNRNPGIDKATMESYFKDAFGIQKTIWIPGQRGYDITDDHIDALARFASPGRVLLSKPYTDSKSKAAASRSYHEAKEILASATDAQGRSIETIDVPEPNPKQVLGKDYYPEEAPCVSYVNYLVINGAVIVSAFGDEECDREAARIIGEQYPGRSVEQVYLHQLALQGGGIHCATQQIPA